MKLNEFHILERQAGANDHGVAVAGAGVSAGAREVGAAIAARGDDRLLGADTVNAAILEAPSHDAAADAIIHDEVEREVLDEELGGMAQRLPIERVQHGMAGAVRGGASPERRGAIPEIGRHAAEGTLIDFSVLGAAERHAVMLKLVDRGGCVAAQILDGVLVAEPVGPFHGVVHVPAPVVPAHIAERGGDAALRSHRVRTGRKHLGDASRLEPGLGAAKRRAKPGAARPHDHDIEGVILHRVGAPVHLGRTAVLAVAVQLGCIRHVLHSQIKLDDRERAGNGYGERPERIQEQTRHLQPMRRVFLGDNLHAEPHMKGY